MHNESRRYREARNLRLVLTTDLNSFAQQMPRPASATLGKQATQPVSDKELPDSIRLMRRGSPVPINKGLADTRRGSVVPAKTEPARTRQQAMPGQDKDQDYGR